MMWLLDHPNEDLPTTTTTEEDPWIEYISSEDYQSIEEKFEKIEKKGDRTSGEDRSSEGDSSSEGKHSSGEGHS